MFQQRVKFLYEVFLPPLHSVFPDAVGGQTTPDYLQKQTTLADILQFEQAHPWTRQLRESLDADPSNERGIENALLHMMLEKSHPLSKLRQRLQYSLFCKLNPLVEQNAHLLDAVRVPVWSPAPTSPAAGQTGARLWPELPEQRVWPELPSSDSDEEEGEGRGAEAPTPPRQSTPPRQPSADTTDSRERDQQDEAFRRHLRNVISGEWCG